MANDNKKTRRKNLTFRPKGENPLHDEAVRLMDQIGRGMCDFVASAVVYYAAKLAEDKIDPEFTKFLNVHTSRPKMLVVQNPLGSASFMKEDIQIPPEVSHGEPNRSIDATDIPTHFNKEPDVISEKQSFEKQPFESPSQAEDSQIAGKYSLPTDLLNSLVLGFGQSIN